MKNCHNCPHHQEGDYCDRFGRFIDPDHPHVWCQNEEE